MTKFLASLLRRKPVAVAEAAAVDERQTPLRIPVEEPLVVFALARSLVLAKETDPRGSRRNANTLALIFLVEVVPTWDNVIKHFSPVILFVVS
jgi:hypothetical protein